MSTIRGFHFDKDAKVLLPLKLGKYFQRYKDVNEMDWYDEIKINDNLKCYYFYLQFIGQKEVSLIQIKRLLGKFFD